MESENFSPEIKPEQTIHTFTTVTPLSKYLAMALFVLLPFIGGWVGYTYAPEKVVEVEKIINSNVKEVSNSNQASEVATLPQNIVFRSAVIKGGGVEGTSSLVYEFSYPESDFLVTPSPDYLQITIEEIATGNISKIQISNEDGRGMSPQDYWNYILKPACVNCTSVANPIVINDALDLVTYAESDKKWIIFSIPSWLFVAELDSPSTKVEQILSTLKIVE